MKPHQKKKYIYLGFFFSILSLIACSLSFFFLSEMKKMIETPLPYHHVNHFNKKYNLPNCHTAFSSNSFLMAIFPACHKTQASQYTTILPPLTFKINKKITPLPYAHFEVSNVYYHLKKGSSLREIAKQLNKQNIIAHPRLFIYLTHFLGYSKHLQSGEYLFQRNTPIPKVLQKLVQGHVIQYPFTIIEGSRLSDIFTSLNAEAKRLFLTKKLYFPPIPGAPSQENYEGYFYPDTYFFTKNTSSQALLKRANNKMREILSNAWQNRAAHLPYRSPYDALIVASLIEKETAFTAEKKLIAGVIVLRLEKRMPLQIDASVIYGLGKSATPPLKKKQLSIDTAYNTYLHAGLPPHPIAMPSKESIVAALHPDISQQYLYFVAKGDGSHVFSQNLAEQTKAINQYLKKK